MQIRSQVSKLWSLPVRRTRTGRRAMFVRTAVVLVVAPLLLGAGAGAAAMNAVGLGLIALVVRRLTARRAGRRQSVWRPCVRCGT